MRSLIAVVVLLVIVLVGVALAADPPGGPKWYQLMDDKVVTTTFEGQSLLIVGGTPGLLVGFVGGQLRIQFERGVAASRNGEITTATSPGAADALTVLVAPTDVRAMLKQVQKTLDTGTPRRGGAEPGALGALGGGGIGTAAGVGGSRAIGVQNDTTLVVDDRVNVVRRGGPDVVLPPDAARPAPQVLPPSTGGSGSGAGGATRVIGLAEHEEWLAKVLRLLGEDGARCETKAYGPGWVSICEPRGAA